MTLTADDLARAGMRVAPLEWEDASDHDGEGGIDWWTQTSTQFGTFTLVNVPDHTLPWLLEPFLPGLASNYATQREAKTALGQYLQNAIISALEPTP